MQILPHPSFPTAFTVGQPQAHHALSTDGALSTTMRGKLERTYGKIYVPSWELRCWSLAIVIIWKAALQKQLAHVHKGRREEGRQGKTRRNRVPLTPATPALKNREQVSHSLWLDGYHEWNIVPMRDKSLLNPRVTPTLER
eukprot:superscaffoldBa00004859_g19541